MLFLILAACLLAVTHAGCPMRPTVEQTSAGRTAGDGGYRILISGQTGGYIPNAIHTISLRGCMRLKDCLKKINRIRKKNIWRNLIINTYYKNFVDRKVPLLKTIDVHFRLANA